MGRPATPPPEADADAGRLKRVAIIGGGCAGMAAAWELSRLPGYQVSVFERSWRLGGKGASGRAGDGRILEHGLHVWLGFYENAFRMIRECYDEVQARNWGPQAAPADRLAHGRFEDAFYPEPHVGVTALASGKEVVWSGLLPPEKGLPGDRIDAESNPFTLASYLMRCVHLLKTLMLSAIGHPDDDVPGKVRPEGRSALDQRVDLDFSLDPSRSPELLIQSIAGRLRDGTLTLAAALLQAVTIFENVLQDFNHSPQAAGSVLNLLKALASQVRKQLRDVTAIDPKLRMRTEVIDIVMTIAVGLYRDRVLLGNKGLDALNDLDYRDWLMKHGLTKTARDSQFLTGIYDLVFAYESGDRRKPRLAAGVALRGALRMFFTYRGSMFWRMRSGMGDAVFAPLYKVLSRGRRRAASEKTLEPVRFHFLHELTDVTFDFKPRGGALITALTFQAPVALRDDRTDGNAPAKDREVLDHFGCWPSTEDQLLPGGPRTPVAPRTLRAGEDFDFVILATGLDDFAGLTGSTPGKPNSELPEPWKAALKRPRQTVATTAAQYWFAESLKDLGWYRGSGLITALGLAPFDTWADMTSTLPSERAWRRADPSREPEPGQRPRKEAIDRARSVAYFCGVLAEADLARGAPAGLDAKQSRNVSESMTRLWPAAKAVRALQSHFQVNVEGSDRYSLSLPGSVRDRLSPLDRSVLNATVAGDWTACGLDAGCVEAAVMSGMLAAHAITGDTPSLESIVGYDHP